jgi:hypothetical protein
MSARILQRKSKNTLFLFLTVCGAAIAAAKIWGPVVIPTTEAVDAANEEYALARAAFSGIIRPTMSLANKAKAMKNHDIFRVIYSDHVADFTIEDPDFSFPIIFSKNVASSATPHSYYQEHAQCYTGSVSDLYATVPTGYWTQSWPDANTTVATWQSTGSVSIYVGGRRLKSCTVTA